MKTFSVSVPESDYEAFRQAATARNLPFDDLVREAIALYRAERIQGKEPLTDLPVLLGHHLVGKLPLRTEVWDEILQSDKQLKTIDLFGQIDYDPAYDYKEQRRRR